VLRLRNATQTSLVLEWDPIHLATTTLRSLALYRNGSKAGNIPRPLETLSTKMSGLQIDTEYSFYLVLKTSGGVYTSNTLTVKTHTMNNLTGITVTPGILPPQLRESLESAVERIGAKLNDTIRIDTTHFVCTEGRGRDWEKANEMNIPIVRPEWVEGCEREGKIIGVRGYYLDADPKQRQVGSNPALAQARSSTTTVPQEVNMPQRPRDSGPKSPDQESTVSGEPGPEVLPTPPPQKELPPTPAADDDDDEGEEDGTGENQHEHSTTESKGKGKATDDDPPEDEDDEDEEDAPEAQLSKAESRGPEMEDVAL
jgi:chitin biosynthesis protein CHS5